MSKPKHTPGPWTAIEVKSGLKHWKIFEQTYNGFEICSTATAEVQQDEANARLIAAAPELLEALSNIENDDGHIPKTIWDLRNQALKKARGEY